MSLEEEHAAAIREIGELLIEREIQDQSLDAALEAAAKRVAKAEEQAAYWEKWHGVALASQREMSRKLGEAQRALGGIL